MLDFWVVEIKIFVRIQVYLHSLTERRYIPKYMLIIFFMSSNGIVIAHKCPSTHSSPLMRQLMASSKSAQRDLPNDTLSVTSNTENKITSRDLS